MKKKISPIPSDDFEKNLNRVLRFLSFRVRSEKEIRDYLFKKNVSDMVSKKIIDKLKEYKFLNDEEFAKIWIETRNSIKPKPWRIIKYELRQKGISREIIESFEPEPQAQEENDLKAAVRIAEKRISRYKGLTKQEIFQKLGRYLVSKGFDYETVKKVLASTESLRSRD